MNLRDVPHSVKDVEELRKWCEEAYEYLKLPILKQFKSPSAITVTAGDVTGTVADLQKWNDGNVLQIDEVAATPGFDVEFTFSGIRRIQAIASNIFYDGQAAHHVEFQIYHYGDTTFDTLLQVEHSQGYNNRFGSFLGDYKEYIDGGVVRLKLVHVDGGNASHVAFVDVVCLAI